MKKIILSFILMFFLAQLTEARLNEDNFKKEILPTLKTIKKEIKPTVAVIREETRKELNQISIPTGRNEIRNEIRLENKGAVEEIKNQIKEKSQNLRLQVKIIGNILEISDKTWNIRDSNGKIYEIKIDEKTQLKRKYFGNALLSDFSEGDQIMVIGKFINEEKTIIEAILIKNLLLEKRWGVFFGEVKEVYEKSLVLRTSMRGELTVYLGAETKIINRREELIEWKMIAVGHRLRVKGVWDKKLKEIKEVEEIKNFSLPSTLNKTVSPVNQK